MKEKQKKYTDIICDFLKSHNLISISTLEQNCSIPETTIAKAMVGNRLIPEKFIFSIIYELAKYGLVIGDWKVTADTETRMIFLNKFIRNVKDKEIKNPDGGSHFVYVLEEYRDIIEDYYELR